MRRADRAQPTGSRSARHLLLISTEADGCTVAAPGISRLFGGDQ